MTSPIRPRNTGKVDVPADSTIRGKEDEHRDVIGDKFGEALTDQLEVSKNSKLSPRIKQYADSVFQAETKKMMDKKKGK